LFLYLCADNKNLDLAQIIALLQKDLRLEFRKGYALGGLIIFVLCIVYLIFLGFGELPARTWVTMYWIAFLFISVHTVLKGFALEDNDRYLYYDTLIRPEGVFVSKCLYHTCAVTLLGLLQYGALSIVAGDPFSDHWTFLLGIFLGAVGISLCFTFVSAIAVKSDQSTTLMTILSFPLIIPVFLHLMRLSRSALPDSMITDPMSSLSTLGAIYLLIAGLGLLLFPYLWRS
jgi:heme exporter protein B